MSTHRRLRHRHPLVWLGLAALVALQVAVRLWPLLLVGGAGFVVYRVSRHRSHHLVRRPAQLVQGHVVTDDTELRRLRDENAKLRTKARVLSDMINGPKARP